MLKKNLEGFKTLQGLGLTLQGFKTLEGLVRVW
jgi:hypothetical protein